MHGRRHARGSAAVPWQHHSREPPEQHLEQLLEFYPEPNNGTAALGSNNYLSLQNRNIDKYQFTQRMDFVQNSWSHGWAATATAMRTRSAPALEAERHQAENAGASGRDWVTRGRCRRALVNEFRFGFNYFFNTFGRELAFERDVVKELNIPGIALNPPEAWGIPSIGITGFSGFGDNTEGPYTNRNKAFEFTDNVSWIRGRHSFKAGGAIRYDMYNQVGTSSRAAISSFRTSRPDTRSPTTCLATRSRTKPPWRWR